MPRTGGVNPTRVRSEYYRVMGGVRADPPRRLPPQFNSGPTPRDAIWDLVDFIQEHPEVWDKL